LLRDARSRYRGMLTVELLDHKKRPLRKARVFGRWMGLSSQTVTQRSGKDGVAVFYSSYLRGKKPLFGFVLERVIYRKHRTCSLKMLTHMTKTSLTALQNSTLGHSETPWLIRLDKRYLSLVYPLLAPSIESTTVLYPSGTGLLSSVRVFGDDLLFQNFPGLWSSEEWGGAWNLGVGSANFPFDFAEGGAATFWTVQASTQAQKAYWSSLSVLTTRLPGQNKKAVGAQSGIVRGSSFTPRKLLIRP